MVEIKSLWNYLLECDAQEIPKSSVINAETQANTACTRLVGVCAFSGSLRGLKLVPAK